MGLFTQKQNLSPASDFILSKFNNLNGNAKYNGPLTEIITYCPNCEKDRYNNRSRHGHLYVSTDNFLMDCKKCEFSGHVSRLYKILGIDGTEPEIQSIGSIVKIKPIQRAARVVTDDDIKKSGVNYSQKIEYLKKRICNINDDLNIPGLVLNFRAFVEKNSLDNVNDNFIKILDANYVGFLLNNSSIVVCRRINNDESLRRYSNLRVFDTHMKDYYSIPRLDPMDYEIPELCFCEGIIDCVNIVNSKLLETTVQNAVSMTACLGSSYVNTARSLCSTGAVAKINVSIFGDNDDDVKKRESLYREYMKFAWVPYVDSLTLYMNKNGKDYSDDIKGVELKKIKLKHSGNIYWNMFPGKK